RIEAFSLSARENDRQGVLDDSARAWRNSFQQAFLNLNSAGATVTQPNNGNPLQFQPVWILLSVFILHVLILNDLLRRSISISSTEMREKIPMVFDYPRQNLP